MTMQATPARVMWLIARLRLQRLWNMLVGFKFKSSKNTKSRPATAMKKGFGWVLSVLVAGFMLFTLATVARQSVLNVHCYLEPASQCMEQADGEAPRMSDRVAANELHASHFGQQEARALSFQLLLLLGVSILIPLSSKEIATADWDLEWLVTLPARRSTLLWGRIVERTVVNPTGWIFLLPTCTVLAWYSGFGWWAPVFGLGAALVLLPMAAMLRTLADTGLRMTMPPSSLRNMQAITGVIGMPFMYFALALGTVREKSFVMDVVRALPDWLTWTPAGLVVRLVDAATPQQLVLAAALLALQLALVLAAGMLLMRYQLRSGVVGSGAREAGRRPQQADSPSRQWLARLLPESPIKRRELRLLSRDRNFLVQSLLLPVVIFGSQLIISGSPSAITDLADSPKLLGGFAFGIASYMLMLSAFQTINNEGQSLWLLYTFPRPIENVLKEKAEFWAVLALAYPALILGTMLWIAPHKASAMLAMFAVVLAGIPIFSLIAVSLGVFASNPLAQDARTKVKIGHAYLYMMLSGLYVLAVTSTVWAQKLVLIILLASLAVALWQKARDRLPYLLDPAVAPPARVSTADGLIAALLFFVLQGGLLFLLMKVRTVPLAEAVLLAFSVAGLLVFGLMRLVFWLQKSEGVPRLVNGNLLRSVGGGIAGGILAAGVAAAYLGAMQALDLMPDTAARASQTHFAMHWLFLLAVVAAPLCEEFIFRGLVFGGLRRSMGMAPAIVMSAALFAIVHPPVSMAPVFVLGLVTAYAYERSRSLLAPVLVHAVYNGALLVLQLPA